MTKPQTIYPFLLFLFATLLVIVAWNWKSSSRQSLPQRCNKWISFSFNPSKAHFKPICFEHAEKNRILGTMKKRLSQPCFRKARQELLQLQQGWGFEVLETSSQKCQVQKKRFTVPQRLMLGIPISLNVSSKQELLQIPGMRKKAVHGLIELRKKFGRIHSWEQVRQVKGIGPTTIRKLKRYASF